MNATRYMMVWCAVGIASGVSLRSFFNFDLYLFSVVVLLCCVCVCVMWLYGRLSLPLMCAGVVAVCSVVVGVVRTDHVYAYFDASTHQVSQYLDHSVVLDGVVSRDVQNSDSGRIVVLSVNEINGAAHDVVVKVTMGYGAPLHYGERVRVRGVLREPESFETDAGRIFPYSQYLRAQGITHTLSHAEVVGIQRSARLTKTETLIRMLYDMKARMQAGIEAVLPEPYAGFGEGLLLGEKHGLGESLEETFRTVGVVHIIVLSGYNLAIVAEAVMRLLSFIFFPRMRAAVGIVTIVLFAFMVGLSATVVRAAIMAVLVLVARVFGKNYIALIGLSVAASVMVLFNPYVLLYDPGFQLSFLATLGLIFVSPMLESALHTVPTALQIREYLTSTLATQVFVSPYLLYSIGSVSLISLVANVLILPAVPLAMLATFLSGLFGIVWGEQVLLLGYPAYLLLGYILVVAQVLSHVPFASVTVPAFSPYGMLCLYGGMAVFLWYVSRTRRADNASMSES